MSKKDLLSQYTKKIKFESVLKSMMIAASIAFAACFVTAFAIWFTDFRGWWVSIVVFGVLFAALTPVFYFFKFRPTEKDVARRLDRLGLDERIVTMIELEGDESFIAKRQRRSAVEALGTVNSKMLKVAVSGVSIAALAVTFVLGVGMTTVETLSYTDYVPTGKEVVEEIVPEPDVYYVVRYEIVYVNIYGMSIPDATGCEIDGNAEQVVLAGADAEPVLAYVEDEGGDDWVWVFYGWYDEIDFTQDPLSTDPYRQDLAVSLESGEITEEDGDIVITHHAVFLQAPLDGEGEGDGEGDGEGEEGDKPSDAPGEGEGEGEGEGSEDGEGAGAGSGKDDDENQIIDGETYYGDRIDEYEGNYQDYVNNGGEIPDDMKDFIENYYDSIN